MSKVAIAGNASGTGTFTIAAPNSNTDRTLTLPDEAGTVLTSASSITQNAGPAFKAKRATNQSISHNVTTKVAFNSEIFDTDGCYDSSTNYRFTPTVAGYYQVNIYVDAEAVNGRSYYFCVNLYKNGSAYSSPEYSGTGNASGRFGCAVSDLIYLNGSTDYIECWFQQYDYTAATSINLNNQTMFSAAFVRA